MAQPPVPDHGLGEEPGPDPGLPGGSAASGGSAMSGGSACSGGSGSGGPVGSGSGSGPRRDEDLGLADFALGGAGDTCPPGPELAAAVAGLSGPGWRCLGACDDELIGLLGRWAALESWAAAGKLGVVRELLRRRADPGPGRGRRRRRGPQAPDAPPTPDARPGLDEPRARDDLPRAWQEGTGHEVAAGLALSLPGADKLIELAWALGGRLPRTGALLAAGVIDVVKAMAVARELAVLDDEHAVRAEALIAGQLAGKTAGQAGRLAAAAACAVDPEGAAKRREYAQAEDARVRLWRETTGASALAGFGLPTDAALSAHANINQRAGQYKKATVSPGARMDQLRVLAFLDILNGITAADRITQARAEAQDPGPGRPGSERDGLPDDLPDDPSDDGLPDDLCADDLSADDPRAGDHRDEDPSGPAEGQGGGGGPAGRAGPGLAASVNLTLPLATLLGLADRPGDGHGLGPLDPGLVRDLAAAAARNPHSQWCLTITSPDGYAIGHGCARLARTKQRTSAAAGNRDGPWALTRREGPGPPGGYGTWTLTLPGGRLVTIKLGPVPVTDCDHRYQTASHQPGPVLRHLVQIRDGTCTFPCCSRHARHSDFEHAIPYDDGGRTCACNGAARSRRCHRVKQSTGWTVTQPRPGWHQWTTPSGRTYTQGPMKYPA